MPKTPDVHTLARYLQCAFIAWDRGVGLTYALEQYTPRTASDDWLQLAEALSKAKRSALHEAIKQAARKVKR